MTTPMKPEYRRIYAAVAAIPHGRVASYGEIAARAGLPGRARMAGHALAKTPRGFDLPWHRIVRADGRIALPEGSRGFREQCRRLRAEGVDVRAGRVRMQAHGLHHDLDRAIWGASAQPLRKMASAALANARSSKLRAGSIDERRTRESGNRKEPAPVKVARATTARG